MSNWQDEIPWDGLVDKIKWVARDPNEKWWGYSDSPIKRGRTWMCPINGGPAVSMVAVKMPYGPADWREALAKRPDWGKSKNKGDL